MRMEFLEKGRVEFIELENKHLCIKEEKIQLAKMKEETQRIKEERERMTVETQKMKEEKEIMTMNIDTLPLVQQECDRRVSVVINLL